MSDGSEASRAFGAAVRARREEIGSSRREAARLASLDLTHWQRIERGANPTLHVMLRIAHVLETPLSELTGDLDGLALPMKDPRPLTRAELERATRGEDRA